MFGGMACGRRLCQPTSGPPRCLMHSLDPNKDNESFQKEFERTLKDAGEGWADFTGFVFPASNYSGGEDPWQAKGREFLASCCFNNTTFLRNANFFKAKFVGDAHFCSVRFSQNANFAGALFGKDALFGNTTFGFQSPNDPVLGNKGSGQSDFAGATFARLASFRHTIFAKNVAFAKATFIQNADFALADFYGNASFGAATFTKDADFTSSRFAQDADFTSAKFYGAARWEILSLGTRWAPPLMSFVDAKFMHPEAAIFFNTCLERALFHKCDVSKIRFSTVQWHRRPRNGMQMIFDEVTSVDPSAPETHQRLLKPPFGDPNRRNYLGIAETYQQLKHNYDSKAEYWTAGDFHYGEMEMKRLHSKSRNKWLRRLHSYIGLIAWYKYASEYGQSFVLPAVWFLALLLVFTSIYPLPRIGLDKPGSAEKVTPLSYLDPAGPGDNQAQVWKNRAILVGHSFMTALSVAAFDKEPVYKPHYPLGRLLVFAQVSLTSTVIALFLLALRRQFRR
jgi:hypothetical protein